VSARTLLFVDASPAPGGATRVLLQILSLLDPTRVTAIVACRTGSGVDEAVRAAGHEVAPLALPTLTFAGGPAAWTRMVGEGTRATGALLAILRERRPVLVHGSGLASTLVASVPAALARVPLAWHVHDVPPEDARQVPFVRAAAASARAIVCPSRYARERLAVLGVPPDRCEVVYAGLEVPTEPPPPPPDGPPSLLSVGALTPQKGQHVLLEALPALLARHPGLTLDVVGEPIFDADRTYAESLRTVASGPALEGSVRFLGRRGDVPELLARATVVVHPAAAPETFGLVPLEAMAAGRPVVATRTGGLPEVVEDSVTGTLVEPGDPSGLSAAVDRLLSDAALRGRMGREGWRVAREHFGLEAMRAGLEQSLAPVAGGPFTRAPRAPP